MAKITIDPLNNPIFNNPKFFFETVSNWLGRYSNPQRNADGSEPFTQVVDSGGLTATVTFGWVPYTQGYFSEAYFPIFNSTSGALYREIHNITGVGLDKDDANRRIQTDTFGVEWTKDNGKTILYYQLQKIETKTALLENEFYNQSMSNFLSTADEIVGSRGNDIINGFSGNDYLSGRDGNDAIDGGTDVDIAIYSGTVSQYQITTGNQTTVVDKTTGRDGTDTLTNIERLQFTDKNIALDLVPTQSAGQTSLLIGAVLPGKLAFDASKQALLGSVIGLFDQGFTLAQLSGAILRLPIWDVLTGKAAPTNADIAGYLVNNVYEGKQTTAITNAAIAAMNAETSTTQGAYLASLAASAANQTHVDLVGVQATGLVYGG